MPAGRPPIHPHPGKPFRTIADAANEGCLLLVRCNLCRRSIYFLASDLLTVIDPKHPLHLPPFPCSRCSKIEYVEIKERWPRADDYGHLKVRKLVQVWKTDKLGESSRERAQNATKNTGTTALRKLWMEDQTSRGRRKQALPEVRRLYDLG
ncbi:hypothetical protein [Sulfitobacter sp. DFL-23]|nr:hypothetical protein [Sulfitobacter sp. DFL-23]